jgi:hypothetical protein
MGTHKESPFVLMLRAVPPAVVGAMALQIALGVGGLVLGAVVAGLWLDAQLGTRPLLTLGLGVLSLPVSVWLTYRIAMRAVARARASYEAWAQRKRQAGSPDPVEGQPPARAAKALETEL